MSRRELRALLGDKLISTDSVSQPGRTRRQRLRVLSKPSGAMNEEEDSPLVRTETSVGAESELQQRLLELERRLARSEAEKRKKRRGAETGLLSNRANHCGGGARKTGN